MLIIVVTAQAYFTTTGTLFPCILVQCLPFEEIDQSIVQIDRAAAFGVIKFSITSSNHMLPGAKPFCLTY